MGRDDKPRWSAVGASDRDDARRAESWTTQQLAEFLAIVSSFTDEPSALIGGVEGAAEALDAEVAALVDDGSVLASIGFPAGKAPAEALVRAAAAGTGALELAGVGACDVITASLGSDQSGVLLVARAGTDGYSQEETDLLRGMGRVLALALRTVHLLEEERRLRAESERHSREKEALVGSLRERQVLLEKLSKLQRSIASRAALEDVLEGIVRGAFELLGDETVGLRLVSADDRNQVELVAWKGIEPELLPGMRHSRVGTGAGGRAISEGRLVVIEEYESTPEMVPQMVSDGISAALAAPVFQRGEVVGSLVVATHRRGRRYSDSEREALQAFAEHAGLALNDAKAAEETAHQAFHDALTELPNRALFLDRLRLARARAMRHGNSVAVLFADLDGFKTVNDSLGHASGDQLLIAVGQRLSEALRPADTVARFGGDEFAILMEEVNEPIDAARAAQRALEIVERPFEVDGRAVFVTASIGVAVGREEPHELLRNADLAMYEAKGRGKGRYELFQREMHRAMTDRLELEQDLKRAFKEDEFVLHYQPIVELDGGRIIGVEALVRWRHPNRGMIAPGRFISIAEDSGQIHAIGRWVLGEACLQAANWQADHGPLEISVNLSSPQLRQASLVPDVEQALADSGLEPPLLILEITEAVLMDATASNIERLAALKRIGVQLAVDDFGTGYTSLQYLRRFPIDRLKIAKPFVDGVHRSDEEAGLTRAIVDLASSLNLGVVAEGIEAGRQSSRLMELDCASGQGFFYSPPLPPDEIAVLLDQAAPFAARRLGPTPP
ncbi:MAG: EAL domain-containing protein [Actinomycetota bacterium]|nr:EAL domain-containing protein [Actinomycetota bacterium]